MDRVLHGRTETTHLESRGLSISGLVGLRVALRRFQLYAAAGSSTEVPVPLEPRGFVLRAQICFGFQNSFPWDFIESLPSRC